jgi:hypothetical protein
MVWPFVFSPEGGEKFEIRNQKSEGQVRPQADQKSEGETLPLIRMLSP